MGGPLSTIFGSKNPTPSSKKQHLKFVILGRSGAGKTTFINSVVNHFYGMAYDDKRVIAITQQLTFTDPQSGEPVRIRLNSNIDEFRNKQSDVGGSQSVSQTSKSNIYDLENDQFKLTMIDTPGLCDTGGIMTDRQHCKNISTATAALTDFNAIILVHKANDCRKDVMLCYLISEFKSMLPKDCANNFLICFTNAVTKVKIDAIQVIKEMGLPCTKDNHFAFENDSLTPPLELLKLHQIEYPYKSDADFELAMTHLKVPLQYWNQNREEFKKLLVKAQALVPLPGNSFVEIWNKKEILVKMVQRNSDQLMVLQDESKRSQDQLQRRKEIKERMDANKDYLTSGIRQIPMQRTIKVKKFVDTLLEGREKTTQCMTCKNLCHERCGLDQIYSQGHLQLKNCLAFGGNPTCIYCKHDFSEHTHTSAIRMEVEEEVVEEYFEEEVFEVTDSNKEELFKQAKSDVERIEAEIALFDEQTAKKNQEIQSTYRIIAYLHRQISETTVSANNEYFLRYIEHRRFVTERDTTLSAPQRAAELDLLAKSERDYLEVKRLVTNSPTQSLTAEDKASMEAEYKALEAEQAKVIAEFQGDRSRHNAAQVERKKSLEMGRWFKRYLPFKL